MRTEEFHLKMEGSVQGAKLCTYILDIGDGIGWRKRPLILICPGGGYEITSDREAEPLAMQFLAMGYHAAVLRYSCKPAVFPTALTELANAMKIIKENTENWNIEPGKVFVLGCSAGGHLAASLGTFWNKKWLENITRISSEILRPAGMILCYPVITSGEYAHRASFENLLGEQYGEEMLEKVSLEKQVTEDVPQAFLWHTYTDTAVPVENSLLFIEAMRKYKTPVEFHMYPVGSHGLATCGRQTVTTENDGVQQECESWLPLVRTWLEHR